jgi:hypothetical protein
MPLVTVGLHRPVWAYKLADEFKGPMGEISEARRGPPVRLIAIGVRAVIHFLMREGTGHAQPRQAVAA